MAAPPELTPRLDLLLRLMIFAMTALSSFGLGAALFQPLGQGRLNIAFASLLPLALAYGLSARRSLARRLTAIFAGLGLAGIILVLITFFSLEVPALAAWSPPALFGILGAEFLIFSAVIALLTRPPILAAFAHSQSQPRPALDFWPTVLVFLLLGVLAGSHVQRLQSQFFARPDELRVTVVDDRTGQPLPAAVTFFPTPDTSGETSTLRTDRRGEALFFRREPAGAPGRLEVTAPGYRRWTGPPQREIRLQPKER